MRISRAMLLICLYSLLTLTADVAASLVPDLNLAELATGSDLIAVGQVVAVRDEGPTTVSFQGSLLTARSFVARLKVQTILKGQSKSSRISVRFSLPQAPIGYRGIPSDQFGVFFLRQADDDYEIFDPYHPFVVAAQGAPRTDGAPLELVTAELAYVFVSPQSTAQTRRGSVEALRTLQTPAATAALRLGARETDINTRLLAVSALIERGDISFLRSAVQALVSPSRSLDPYLAYRLARAIEFGVTKFGVNEPEGICELTPLLAASDVRTRRAAAGALRSTRAHGAIGPLTKALMDSDREVQYQAVIGLAEITGGPTEWSPAYDTFLKDQKRYLDHWRDWAKSLNQRKPSDSPSNK
jgi:HEAT repeats